MLSNLDPLNPQIFVRVLSKIQDPALQTEAIEPMQLTRIEEVVLETKIHNRSIPNNSNNSTNFKVRPHNLKNMCKA